MSWLQITFGKGREANKDLGEVKRQRKKKRQRIWFVRGFLLTRASVLVLLCTVLRRNQHQESVHDSDLPKIPAITL